jgi:cytochrome P450
MDTLNNFIAPFVERAILMSSTSAKRDLTEDETEKKTFTHSLSEFTRDRKVMRDQLVSTLLAGRDTTACTLSWLFYELSYHPEIYTKLRKEVLDTIGQHEKPTYEDLKNMKYLQHCINESTPPLPVVDNSTPLIPHRPIQCAHGSPRYYPPPRRRPLRS